MAEANLEAEPPEMAGGPSDRAFDGQQPATAGIGPKVGDTSEVGKGAVVA